MIVFLVLKHINAAQMLAAFEGSVEEHFNQFQGQAFSHDTGADAHNIRVVVEK